jgi:hypothetical protein
VIRAAYWQLRLPLLIAVLGLAAVGIFAAITGPALAHSYQSTLGVCGDDCSAALRLFNSRNQIPKILAQAIPLAVPAVLGMFWGAPLVARELESGAYRLAWTQGRSRLRWFAGRLAVIGLAGAVLQGAITLALTWWWRPVERANHDRFGPLLFGAFGIAPIGYALFALALGVAAGAVARRTLPAMATTLALFVGARAAVTYWLRPHFAPPVRAALPISANNGVGLASTAKGQMSLTFFPPDMPGAWLASSATTDSAGRTPAGAVLREQCPDLLQAQVGAGDLRAALDTCVAALSADFRQRLAYQPASRYWPFQWAELGLFAGLAAALAGFAAWWLARRLG